LKKGVGGGKGTDEEEESGIGVGGWEDKGAEEWRIGRGRLSVGER